MRWLPLNLIELEIADDILDDFLSDRLECRRAFIICFETSFPRIGDLVNLDFLGGDAESEQFGYKPAFHTVYPIEFCKVWQAADVATAMCPQGVTRHYYIEALDSVSSGWLSLGFFEHTGAFD